MLNLEAHVVDTRAVLDAVARTIRAISRRRFVVFALLCVVFSLLRLEHRPLTGDWIYVEMGARALSHHLTTASTGSPLHLYADVPSEQIGPPALLLAVPLQYLPPHLGERLGPDLLCFAVLPLTWLVEDTARRLGRDADLELRSLVAGLMVVPAWCTALEAWGHVDDVLAVLLVVAAVRELARGGRAFVVAALLGTAAAAKPWAAIVVPLLLVLPRPARPRAVLVFLAAALAWWLPFVAAAPSTVHALGSFSLPITAHTTWSLLGMQGTWAGWQRSLELFGGVVLCAAVVRRGSWIAVPAVAFVWRICVDPYSWPYYVLAPIAAALLLDLAGGRRRRLAWLPPLTTSVFVAEFALLRWAPAAAAPVRLVVLLLLVVQVLARPRRQEPDCVERAHRAAELPAPVPA